MLLSEILCDMRHIDWERCTKVLKVNRLDANALVLVRYLSSFHDIRRSLYTHVESGKFYLVEQETSNRDDEPDLFDIRTCNLETLRA